MTALFEHRRTPQERVVVADPASCWVGVDPSTRALAMAAVLANGERHVALQPLPAGLRGAERLAFAHRMSRVLSARLSHVWGPFGVVVVEEPLRSAQDMVSQQMVGAVQAGLYEGAGGPQMTEIAGASWKKIATGYGGHRKPKKAKGQPAPDPLEYGVLAWARAAPWEYAGESWDVADACGIAEAAYQLYDLVHDGSRPAAGAG